LVHGYGAASSWWRRNIEPLAAQRQVYAPDLGGFGRSWPKHHFSLARTVDCIVSWMQDLGIQRADFCGHSMGGQVCIRLAAAHPERVRKLVLVDASGFPLNAPAAVGVARRALQQPDALPLRAARPGHGAAGRTARAVERAA
jgi:pimeloyl-ACP methyl ester carboxylesterase